MQKQDAKAAQDPYERRHSPALRALLIVLLILVSVALLACLALSLMATWRVLRN
jgi:hypothetical protein